MRRSDPPLALSLLAVNCRYTHGESALADSVLGRSGFSWESAPLPVRGPPGPCRAFMEFDLYCTSWVFPAFSWIFIKFNFFSISWIFRNFPRINFGRVFEHCRGRSWKKSRAAAVISPKTTTEKKEEIFFLKWSQTEVSLAGIPYGFERYYSESTPKTLPN